MRSGLRRVIKRSSALAVASCLLGLPASVLGQVGSYQRHGTPIQCQPPCVQPCPSPARPEPAPAPRVQPEQPATPIPEPVLADDRFAALAGETVAVAAPNMIGDLLGASRSISFVYHRAGAVLDIENGGFVNTRNAKVAENNSPLPQDRVSFRYHHFHNALAVGGVGEGSVPGTNPPQGILETKNHHVDAFTFGVEKTWFDGRVSTELRVPFANTLSSQQDLRPGVVTGIDPQGALLIASTPGDTLGEDDLEFGDISLIVKGLISSSPQWVFAGGVGITAPTADDTSVRVTDFFGFVFQPASGTRIRQFDIENETWEIAPYVAALYTPNDRVFMQGFLQFSIPAGESKVRFSQTAAQSTLAMDDGTLVGPGLPPFTFTDRIEEQALLHIDVGVGYWLRRNPGGGGITGIAPSVELHYTTTLEDAEIITLPGDELVQQTKGFRDEPPSLVGNLANRVDILNLTAGLTIVLGDRVTIANGFAVPLRDDNDRVFDWEYQLQINYYFGAR